jgi:hypothetical protein
MKQTLLLIPLLLVLACSSIYTGVVTITSVVDAAMKNWAQLSVAGKTSPAVDAAVTKAHDQYRKAAGVAQTALLAYKAGGNQADYLNALAAVRTTADGLVDLIVPLLTPSQGANLKIKLTKASAL